MSNGYGKYKKAAVESANKEKILLMLYEGAIRFIKQASEAIDNKDIAKRGEYIGRAYDIIMELMSSLNYEVGGEMAKSLEQLYIYCMEELTRANLTGDKKNLQNCLKVLDILYDGWCKAIESVKRRSRKVLKEESNINLIMQLLEEKNELLCVFLEISENERRSFKARNFENLELLYASREELLENIQSIDKRLDLYSEKEDPQKITVEQKKRMEKALNRKQILVNEILAQDLVMLSCIDNEKSGLIKKISSVRTGRRLMKAYRRLPDIVD